MAIKLGGEFEVKRNPEEVYDFLTDPTRFGAVLPDFEGLSVQDATHFTVKVKVGVGFIKSSAEVKMELTEADRPSRAQYKGHGNMAGSNVSLTAAFDLSPVNAGTKVAWQGEAEVSGKLVSLGGSLLEPLAKKNLQKLIDGLRGSLA
jgi:2-furoyl-CoA dehydrogenase large subunit